MSLPPSPDDDAPITREQLADLFRGAEKPEGPFRIGGEAEKFGVDRTKGSPIEYEGPRGVRRIFEALVRDHGWTPVSETADGPVIALVRDSGNITLEPAAQLELSGAPMDTVHDVCRELREHIHELAAISLEMNVAWLGVGFHPLARPDDLPWVPKRRYPVMRRYLPTRGSRGLDMMQRTATVQANFDYASEADAMQKLVLLLRVSPLLNAMTANSPFVEGKASGKKSERGDVWLHMDPARSGLIPSLWSSKDPGYDDYIEWALDAGMFLFRRGDQFIENTGQTFRSFLADGFQGHRATQADWISHVNSLFPEARLKRTLEARSADSLPQRMACSVPALLTGILYDARAFDETCALLEPFDYATVEASRPELVTHGLAGHLGGAPVQGLAERLLEIADGGLERRGRLSSDGKDERVHLDELRRLVSMGRTPADELLDGVGLDAPDATEQLIARTGV